MAAKKDKPEEEKKEEASKEEEVPETDEAKPTKGKGRKKKADDAPAAKRPEEENPDFRHLVRLASTDLDGHKQVVVALSGIKGVGKRLSYLIADHAKVPRIEKIGNLKDEQITALNGAIEGFMEQAPGWIVNRQRDYDTGDDIHLIGPDVEVYLREDLNRLKKVRTYRGVRHEAGLPVRGQRTRANGRSGLTVGVQRKKEGPAAAGEGTKE